MSMGGAPLGMTSSEDQIRKMTMTLMEKCKKRMAGRTVEQLDAERGVSAGLRRRHGL